ncbi:Sorbitol dehydrogenase [Grimontia celer]|uniref:Sorbitol dehydrogenase n=1 Tax=Grimontia celer TaxID=1796497 RepID=A0A128ETV5_9GAMM|nr:SDR family oxidoreductase [Grimontia celer]CZF77535.1 Sorbitol dehydrogenase [Grimontia celer]
MQKRVWVTGGSRGIGFALAQHFVEGGHKVLVIAKNENSLDSARQRIEGQNPEADFVSVQLDFSDAKAVDSKVQKLLQEFGTPDILVSNAGILAFGNTSASASTIHDVFMVNVVSSLVFTNKVAEAMKEKGAGRIFILGSTAGMTPVSKLGVYSASKAAVVSYGQSLYEEMLPHGVDVTCLCPSVVDTDMTDDGRIDKMLKIQQEDIVKAVDYIMSLSPGCAVPLQKIACKVIDLENL